MPHQWILWSLLVRIAGLISASAVERNGMATSQRVKVPFLASWVMKVWKEQTESLFARCVALRFRKMEDVRTWLVQFVGMNGGGVAVSLIISYYTACNLMTYSHTKMNSSWEQSNCLLFSWRQCFFYFCLLLLPWLFYFQLWKTSLIVIMICRGLLLFVIRWCYYPMEFSVLASLWPFSFTLFPLCF